MNREEFLRQVQELAQLPTLELAEEGTRVVFELLSLRLSGGESEDLLAGLPDGVKELWDENTRYHSALRHSREGQLDYKTIDELYALVETRFQGELPVGADVLTAAVLRTLKSQLEAGEVGDVAAQLPRDLAHVWNAL